MRSLFVSASLFALSLAVAGPAEEGTALIDWIDTVGEALPLTRADQRPLLLYFPPLPPTEGDKTLFDDEDVAAALRAFNSVRIGGDLSKAIRTRFAVRPASPTYIVLNGEGEKISRWAGWMPAATFVRYLEQALDRYDLYLAGEPWDAVAITDRDDLRSIDAPEDNWIRGLAVTDDRLWVLHGSNRLFAIDPDSGEILERIDSPRTDISAMTGVDDKLYLASYDWAAGCPIFRFDVRTHEIDAEIVTRENEANENRFARGIAAHADRLYVAHQWATIRTLNIDTGEELNRFRVNWEGGLIEGVKGLDHDGHHLYGIVWAREGVGRSAASRFDVPRISGVATIDDETGEVLDLLPLGFPFDSLALDDGVFVIGDAVRRGHDRQNRPRRTFPPDRVRINFAYP